MGFDPVAGGNVPSLDGAAILARTPGLDALADVAPIDRGLTPASHFTFRGGEHRRRGVPRSRCCDDDATRACRDRRIDQRAIGTDASLDELDAGPV